MQLNVRKNGRYLYAWFLHDFQKHFQTYLNVSFRLKRKWDGNVKNSKIKVAKLETVFPKMRQVCFRTLFELSI